MRDPEKTRAHRGELRFSHFTGGPLRRGWDLELEDHESRTHVLSIRLTEVQFSELMSSMVVEVSYELYPDRVGQRMEVEKRIIRVPRDYPAGPDKQAVYEQQAREKYDHDGWELDASDLFNHHRTIGYHGERMRDVAVHFRRWVPST